MARIRSSKVSVSKISSVGHAYVDYSYEIGWAGNDIKEDLWHYVHLFLWEKDGSEKDYLHTRYNGNGVQVWRDSGSDEFIAHITTDLQTPDGDRTTKVRGDKQLQPSTMERELGEEEFYLQVGLHPNAGGNSEAFSNVDTEKF